MPDSAKTSFDPAQVGSEYTAAVYRDDTFLIVVHIGKDDRNPGYFIYEDGTDLVLDSHTDQDMAFRLADMYLDGFREGFDRGYDAHAQEQAKHNADRLRNLIARWTANESDRRNRDDDEGHSESDCSGG